MSANPLLAGTEHVFRRLRRGMPPDFQRSSSRPSTSASTSAEHTAKPQRKRKHQQCMDTDRVTAGSVEKEKNTSSASRKAWRSKLIAAAAGAASAVVSSNVEENTDDDGFLTPEEEEEDNEKGINKKQQQQQQHPRFEVGTIVLVTSSGPRQLQGRIGRVEYVGHDPKATRGPKAHEVFVQLAFPLATPHASRAITSAGRPPMTVGQIPGYVVAVDHLHAPSYYSNATLADIRDMIQ